MLKDDFNLKVNKIRHLLNEIQKDGLILTTQHSFAWLTGGRGFINTATSEACCKILITHSSALLIVNNIEKERLKSEEGCGLFDEVLSFNWYENCGENCLIHSLTKKIDIAFESDVEEELLLIRTRLTPYDIERFTELGRDAANVMESLCNEVKRGQTEWEIAAQLSMKCKRLNIDPVVNLVASDERVFTYRHPLPTSKTVDRYILLALGARRHGLVISLSRLVHFGRVSEELKRKQEAVTAVDAVFIGNTVPGASYNSIFRKGIEEYKKQGFPEEWKKHHQGGLTGFRSREHRVTLDSGYRIYNNQAFAWNPTISGVKSEDTIITNSDGPKVITRTGNFPEIALNVNGQTIHRPLILERALV